MDVLNVKPEKPVKVHHSRGKSSDVLFWRPCLRAEPTTCMSGADGWGLRCGPDWGAARRPYCFWWGWRRNHWAPQGGAPAPVSCRGSTSCTGSPSYTVFGMMWTHNSKYRTKVELFLDIFNENTEVFSYETTQRASTAILFFSWFFKSNISSLIQPSGVSPSFNVF